MVGVRATRPADALDTSDLGFRGGLNQDLSPIMENQAKKKTENGMEAGTIQRFIGSYSKSGDTENLHAAQNLVL